MDVPTRSTNFIGFIEFYDAILYGVPAVFHCLLNLMFGLSVNGDYVCDGDCMTT